MTESTLNQHLLRIKFHSFVLGDVEDVEIYAAQPMYEWKQTPRGQWAMTHAQDLAWHQELDFNAIGYRITVYGYLEPQLATEYALRFGGDIVP